MIEKLIKLMKTQDQELKNLLELLEIQHNMIMNKDVFGLEGLVDKMSNTSKAIAQEEIKRRNLLEDQSIKQIVSESNNEELKKTYNHIQDILNKVILKKETNEMLLKQQIVFNNKMLAFMNPSREIKTYNSYGNLSR